jgi:4-amino-4-deoxy-L-arabinose transferase-like glycosyltransferase
MARNHRHLAPILVLLVGTSPLFYFFSRVAILEPPLIFFITASALAAYATAPPGAMRCIFCGILFTLAMLTKSSAFFAAPSVLYLLWFPHRHLWSSKLAADRTRAFLAVTVPVFTLAFCYGLYWLLVIHTHPVDIKVFYKQTQPVLDMRSIEKSIRLVYRGFTWIDPVLFPAAVVAAILSVRKLPSLWQDPLFGFAVLFFLGYSSFMIWHFDAPPHYFAVLVVPVMILVLLLLNVLERQMPAASKALGALVLLAVVANVAYIAKLLAHPEYTLRDACLKIRSQIVSDPSATPLVIGHGSILTTYFTHIPALDDLGSVPMAEKIALYHPGWAVVWGPNIDPLNQPSVANRYTFTEMGRYPVSDSPIFQFILLYRIHPR